MNGVNGTRKFIKYEEANESIFGGQKTIALQLNNPPLNILDLDVLKELNGLLDEIEKEPEIKEVVITGQGKVFSAGANINKMKAIVFGKEPFKDGWQFAGLGLLALAKIHSFPKPITALINGTCLGGGMELALACKRRIAVSHAILALPETTIGIAPGWGGLEFIRELLKKGPAAEKSEEISEAVQKGLYLTAKEALDLGLVDEIIDSGQEPKKPPARPYSPTAAQRVARSLSNARTLLNLRMRLALDINDFSELCAMPDAKEGMSAFLDKRVPKFKDFVI